MILYAYMKWLRLTVTFTTWLCSKNLRAIDYVMHNWKIHGVFQLLHCFGWFFIFISIAISYRVNVHCTMHTYLVIHIHIHTRRPTPTQTYVQLTLFRVCVFNSIFSWLMCILQILFFATYFRYKYWRLLRKASRCTLYVETETPKTQSKSGITDYFTHNEIISTVLFFLVLC